METNFLDEIFERINVLEAENKFLKEELKNLNNQNETSIEKYIDYDTQEQIKKINEFKIKNNLDSLFKIEENEINKFVEMVIDFKPYDEFNTLEISGDFTNWKKRKMEKVRIINLFLIANKKYINLNRINLLIAF